MHYTFSQIAVTLTISLIILSACATKPKTSTPANTQTTVPTVPTRTTATTQSIGTTQNKHKTNQTCIDVIKEFEGVRLQAYVGPGGHWLIGYGHKAGVHKGMKISAEKAEAILKEDLRKFEENIHRQVKVELNQNQFSALVCLSYNIGSGNFARSTLLKKLNTGDYEEAANQFAVWRKVNGKVNSHQVKRRALERAIFVE